MSNLEFKFEAANTTSIIYHLNSGAVLTGNSTIAYVLSTNSYGD